MFFCYVSIRKASKSELYDEWSKVVTGDNNRPLQQYHYDQVKWSKSQYSIRNIYYNSKSSKCVTNEKANMIDVLQNVGIVYWYIR
jgi:hypothetical protein